MERHTIKDTSSSPRKRRLTASDTYCQDATWKEEKARKIRPSPIAPKKKEELVELSRGGPLFKVDKGLGQISTLFAKALNPELRKLHLHANISALGSSITEHLPDIDLLLHRIEPGSLKWSCVSALLALERADTVLNNVPTLTGSNAAYGGTITKDKMTSSSTTTTDGYHGMYSCDCWTDTPYWSRPREARPHSLQRESSSRATQSPEPGTENHRISRRLFEE